MGDVADRRPLLHATGLTRHYGAGERTVVALDSVDLAVGAGELVVVIGRSGSGKTTLLNLLGGLDDPTSGDVIFDGRSLPAMDEPTRAATRRDDIGFVFQGFGLLPILSAAENVEVPLRMARADPDERSARALALLDAVGLDRRARHRPDELSGGEQQRVAIARALANRPRVLLADEPTGQLDSVTGADVIDLLASIVRSEGVAAIVASHDAAPLAVADRVVELADGGIVRDERLR